MFAERLRHFLPFGRQNTYHQLKSTGEVLADHLLSPRVAKNGAFESLGSARGKVWPVESVQTQQSLRGIQCSLREYVRLFGANSVGTSKGKEGLMYRDDIKR